MKWPRLSHRHSTLLAAAVIAALPFLVAGRASSDEQEIDINQILRCTAEDDAGKADCDKGRELVIFYCTNCHSFAPIVLQQFDGAGWSSLLNRHRGWIPSLTEDKLATLQRYLSANFRPDLDTPEVPENLLENWTSY